LGELFVFLCDQEKEWKSMSMGGMIWSAHCTGILCMILLSTSEHKMLYLQLLWVFVGGHDNRAMSETYEKQQ
jgi:hypothetical protein